MNWDQFCGKFMQLEGSIRQKWAKLTSDDLEYIAGQRERLVGRIQERYGIAKQAAEEQADDWWKALSEAAKRASAHHT